MSLFDDQFYQSGNINDSSRSRRKWYGVVILAIGFGLLMTFLVFPYLVNRGYVHVDISKNKSENISAVANRLQPAIVNINAYDTSDTEAADETGEYFVGSGVVVRKNNDVAQIVTNYHVVQDKPYIKVVRPNGERLDAKLIAKDEMSDLAIIEVRSKQITEVARFGDSDRLKVGDTVIAIGNPLGLGNTPTVTTGIISAVKRTVPIEYDFNWELDVIQTDAAINEGNSGGALLNLRGELVGIISMKMVDIGVEGLGFAIPINYAQPIIEQMIQYKKVKRPQIGIQIEDLSQTEDKQALRLPAKVDSGVVVLDVIEPAKKAGLRKNDVIVRLDKQDVADSLELRKYLYTEKVVGDRVTVRFYREGKLQSIQMRLAELKLE